MGARVTVENKTPYTWYFSTQDRGETRIDPHSIKCYDETREVCRWIYIRYEGHTSNSFNYEFNTHKGHTSFILSEASGSRIQLHCTSEGGTHYCPKPAR